MKKLRDLLSRIHVLRSVTLYLSNGSKVVATYEPDDYDDLYDQWESGKGILGFQNCCVKASDEIAIERGGDLAGKSHTANELSILKGELHELKEELRLQGCRV
jgi:hypothetical protein